MTEAHTTDAERFRAVIEAANQARREAYAKAVFIQARHLAGQLKKMRAAEKFMSRYLSGRDRDEAKYIRELKDGDAKPHEFAPQIEPPRYIPLPGGEREFAEACEVLGVAAPGDEEEEKNERDD